MANLQYIGARYVPKFYENSMDPSSCEWESGVSYEALTIVTYNGNSYTSKKAVSGDIGDPSGNPAYWVLTGDFNASLIALQNEVSGISDNLNATINTQNKTANNGLGSIQTQVYFDKEPAYWNTIADSAHSMLQGVAYDSTRNRLLYLVLNANDDNDLMLVTVNYSDHITVYTRKIYNDGTIKHGADCCYNETLDKYLVIGDGGTGIIYYINPITLTIDGSISPTGTLSGDDRFSGIAYDNNEKIYAMQSPNGFYLFTESFTLIDYKLINYRSLITDNFYFNSDITLGYNGIEIIDKKIACVVIANISENVINRKNFIMIFDQDGEIFSSYDFKNYHFETEIESLEVINGQLHAFTRWYEFTDTIIITQKMFTVDCGTTENDSITLRAGIDLNSLQIAGFFVSRSSDISKSLINCPTEYPFTLHVTPFTSRANRQILTAYIDGYYTTYVRENTGNTWSSWQRNVIQIISHGETRQFRGIFAGYAASTAYNIFLPDVFIPDNIQASDITITIDGSVFTVDGSVTLSGTPTIAIRNANTGLIISVPETVASPNRPITHFGRITLTVAASA